MNEDVIKERLGERGEDGFFHDDNFVCNQIHYDKDAIIEASAGTGKTYTLQSIVLKLLLEKTIDSVKNLLLVTYTEKAAGELKDKIRTVLEEAGCLPSDFDEVTICTIHSFCRSLLTEYAFENRVPMQTEVCGSDADMIHQAVLKALHSEEYRNQQGPDFVELMTEAGLTADDLVAEIQKNFKSTDPMPESVEKGRGKKKVSVRDCKAILVNALRPIAQRMFHEIKESTSVMTFDDLVERACKVVEDEAEVEKAGQKGVLLEAIRRKYRIALVDEFQDTDSKQWEIFKSIFSHNVNKIDDGPNPKQGALLVVGDPKQAIYSFRGADVGAYLAAKNEITGGDDGKVKRLDTTYRSSPKLVAAFNKIFGENIGTDHSWFEDMKEGSGSIDYKAVDPPPPETKKFDGIDYHSEFGEPVELLESMSGDKPPKTPSSANSGYGNRACCLPEFLCNAAREIKRLVSLKPAAYTTVDKDTGAVVPHTFSYRDMCILVRGHAEADKAREVLAAANIPFSIYKEQGIYASAEAEALLALFDFLSVPSRRGRLEALLLTPLFGYSPDQLEARRKQEDREFSRQLEVWQELVSKKEWSKLFESVMNDTLLAHPSKDDPDFDRSWAATRQILDKLLESVGRKAQTIDEFADVLRFWRQDDKHAGEDGALRRKESEADRVQIMTMHVSKGLEYPVVFIAWGFGKLGSQAREGEKDAAIREEKRLLYVALTRAEHKLYLPWSQWALHRRMKKNRAGEIVDEWDETGIGSVGSALLIPNAEKLTASQKNPDLGFLARGIRALFKSDDAAKEAVIRVSERAKTAESAIKEKASVEKEEETKVGGDGNDADAGIKVYELDAKALARQKIDNDSYSSVHRKAKKNVESAADGGKDDENHDDVASQKKEKTLLPRNNISGDVFHEIMETLCNNDDSDGKTPGFCTVGGLDPDDLAQKKDLLDLIRKTMRKHQVDSQKGANGDTTERVLARMAWRALNVPIVIGGRTIVLRIIGASNRRAELEFVVNRANVLGDEVVTNDPQSESTFNGKIDLLVRPEGRDGPVYILDWKTNSLPSYGTETLGRAMTASDYHLQYQFYSQAVRYWLRGAELGGVAYMFVRAGEKSESLEGDAGVFVADAVAISQESCRAAIKNALK
ncbi:MAG: UvrD-helicase domain-containing protein [Kiritimatiellae bacterium]|nr:UvrD-helicase domain-containing protein [Kiritimatiellia bacterium]